MLSDVPSGGVGLERRVPRRFKATSSTCAASVRLTGFTEQWQRMAIGRPDGESPVVHATGCRAVAWMFTIVR